jgi:putative RNA 2'-phosphotransferase
MNDAHDDLADNGLSDGDTLEGGSMGDETEVPEPVVLDDESAERLSRFLALVLRHRAHNFDLDVDDEGFVPIDDLLDVIDERHRSLDWVEHEHIEELANAPGRRRFEVRDGLVRATYGHSFRRPIHYPKADPPEKLYIGALQSRLADLKAKGLTPTNRQYVHLSESSEEALEIARHQGSDAVSVTVRAADAAKSGVLFHRPADGIYLAAKVPPEYLDIEMQFGRRGRKGRRR